jgi:hypothetical protein
MRKTILTALLLFGVTEPAVADAMSDRFRDDFGDAPPALSDSHAARPASIVAPKPRLRPSHAIARTAALAVAGALPLVSDTSGAGGPPSPAITAIKPSGSIPNEYQVGISWNAMDSSWDGMFVRNSGTKPLSVSGIQLNNRNDCQLKPYSLEKLRKLVSLQQAVQTWGSTAINVFGLPKMEPGIVLIGELPLDLQSLGISPEESEIKVGGRVAILNFTKCESVSVATVDTDVGSISVKFKQPYTGH